MCAAAGLFSKCSVSIFIFLATTCYTQEIMTREERLELREEARDMFYHAYNAYMENAFPADELMPLSCQGRYRGLTPNRGDIDDCLGNFSLTLIDTLDTLVVLGDVEEFEDAVKLVINNVSFDNDVVVSVFETNIRVLGGLLSAHVLSSYLQHRDGRLSWYNGELLDMAKDVGYRLLPAFNTTTGIPHSRVNLMYGIKSDRLESAKETCTACAGSMILEMAALSRLTGEPVFEEKAQKAMDELWKMRHRSSDLMGTILNVHSGDWVRRDSGVGAGIDSYYEYCLKAYILLGDNKYLNRFNRHYNAIMKYISQGPMLLDVHMHKPHTNSRNFMDALLAFWPGLQVLKGDIKPAVETHEMLYQVMQRHKFLPEAFTTDFQVHWGNHPLRPEFLESTYYLYEATEDPYYLQVGKKVLKTLQTYAKVPCGYAAVNDVRTGKKEDRMDSFVLSETFKYLFLLFSDKEDLIINLDEFIFTTEGHLLPLTLGCRNNSSKNAEIEVDEPHSRSCPNTVKLFPESLRKPLENMVDGVTKRRNSRRRLIAHEFSAANVNHLKIIKEMGINIIALKDGRVQLLHTFSSARSAADAEEGLLFMQEMVEFSKLQSQQPETVPQAVTFSLKENELEQVITLQANPAQFGTNLKGLQKITARTRIVHPFRACEELVQIDALKGKIALMERGDCMFMDKVRRAQKAGAMAAIIIDNTPDSSFAVSPMFSMSGDGTTDVTIPSVFLFAQDANKLLMALSKDPMMEVTLSEYKSSSMSQQEEQGMFQKLKVSVQEFLNKHTGIVGATSVVKGNWRAEFGDRVITVFFDRNAAPLQPLPDTDVNKFNMLRKSLVQALIKSNVVIPFDALQYYYKTLSGTTKPFNEIEYTVYLLTQLAIEYQTQEKDITDSLIKLEKDSEISLSLDISDLTPQKALDELDKKMQRIDTLNKLLESVSQLDKNMKYEYEKNKEVMNSVLQKLSESTDEIIVASDKSGDNVNESNSQSDTQSSESDTKASDNTENSENTKQVKEEL